MQTSFDANQIMTQPKHAKNARVDLPIIYFKVLDLLNLFGVTITIPIDSFAASTDNARQFLHAGVKQSQLLVGLIATFFQHPFVFFVPFNPYPKNEPRILFRFPLMGACTFLNAFKSHAQRAY